MQLAHILSIFALLSSPAAFAGHDDGGGNDYAVQRLAQRAQDLNREVQYSYLSYQVKGAVSTFASNASALSSCRSGGYPSPMGHDEPYPGYPDNRCEYQLSAVVSSFSSVEHYLYDTQYDLPRVYSLYVELRGLVEQVRAGGGGGGYNPPYPTPVLSVNGALDGYYFNFSSQDRNDIRRQCVDFAYRNRLYTVRDLTVQGRTYHFGWNGASAQDACAKVAQLAM